MSDLFLLTAILFSSSAAALAGFYAARLRSAGQEGQSIATAQLALERRLGEVENTLIALDFHARESGSQIDSSVYAVLDTLGDLYEGISRLTGRASLESARVLISAGASLDRVVEESGVTLEEAQMLMRFRNH